jgi:hypothetical protein
MEQSNALSMFFRGLKSFSIAVLERQSLFNSLQKEYSQLVIQIDPHQILFSSK